MKRVIGIGGVFFQAQNPEQLRAWYQKHLGMDVQPWGGVAFDTPGATAWTVVPADGAPFAPGKAPFQINYRVENLTELVKALKDEGCHVLPQVEASEYGKFAWVIDPEGNKLELWEAPTSEA